MDDLDKLVQRQRYEDYKHSFFADPQVVQKMEEEMHHREWVRRSREEQRARERARKILDNK